MTLITLIGRNQAEIGKEFYYLGPIADCRDCKLKGVCFNLEAGSRYKVVEIRSQTHECREFHDDEAVAVVVEKIPTPAAIPKKLAMEGSMITFSESKCENLACNNYQLCHPVGKTGGSKYKVVSVSSDLDCPAGEKMVRADLYRSAPFQNFSPVILSYIST